MSARVVGGALLTGEALLTRVADEYRTLFTGVPGRWGLSPSEIRARSECA